MTFGFEGDPTSMSNTKTKQTLGSNSAPSQILSQHTGIKVVKLRAATTIDGKRDHHESVPVVRVDLNHALHVLDIGGPLIGVDAGEHVSIGAGLHHGDHQLQGGRRVLPLLVVRHRLNQSPSTYSFATQARKSDLVK